VLTAPIVVLLPGLACDAELWAAQVPALVAADWRVAVSGAHERHDALDAMALAVLDEHLGPLVLVGASMGAMVALRAAAAAPERVAALALVGGSARADSDEMRALREEAIGLFERGHMQAVLRANVAFAFHPRHHADTALFERYLAMVHRAGVAQLVRQNRAVAAREDWRARLPSIGCPLLALVGEADGLTPPEHAREIVADVPGAQLALIEGAGHLPTMETPERVNELLLEWLARTARAPAQPTQ
jgi:pimeloyl-ACP methyl ester carboxylesterase